MRTIPCLLLLATLSAESPTPLSEAEKARDKALMLKAAAIVDAFANYGASLSNDGKRVLFGSDRGGLPEIYVGDAGRPGEAPRKIAGGPDRVMSAKFTRDGKHVVFLMDKGGDERFHIYRCRVDGTGTVDLTPTGPLHHRDGFLLPRRSPSTLVYTGHVAGAPGTTLFVRPLEGGEPRAVYTDRFDASPADISADGTRVLLLRDLSMSDQIAVEVDLVTGRARQVYPPEGRRAGIRAAAYSPDASRIFVATDEGGEQDSLVALDARTLAEGARYRADDPPTGRMTDIAVSPRGDLVAVAIDAGNHSEARILHGRSFAPVIPVKTLLGTIGLGSFSADGKSLVLTASAPDSPTDVYLADAASGEVKPLRDDKRPGLGDLPPVAVAIENATAFDGVALPLNVHVPKGTAPDQKHPVIVLFHGGPSGSTTLYWDPLFRFFTSLGYAVVAPNIRGSTGFGRAFELADNREKRADAIKDLEAVNMWIRRQSWADPDRIVPFGASYGGYLVLMGLTRQPALWRAGVEAFGLSDLKALLESADPRLRNIILDEFGDTRLLEDLSPIRDIDKIRAPLFVYQGQNDPRVPRAQADTVVRGLRRRGIPVEYMVAPDEGHSMSRRENMLEFFARVARFLDDRMK
ncbi:MAG TPA: S9 family peptidase [Myxococcaceae bacterium]|jgi:dipeptidyl aminopeptidase/acylaminoacyl peptidase